MLIGASLQSDVVVSDVVVSLLCPCYVQTGGFRQNFRKLAAQRKQWPAITAAERASQTRCEAQPAAFGGFVALPLQR